MPLYSASSCLPPRQPLSLTSSRLLLHITSATAEISNFYNFLQVFNLHQVKFFLMYSSAILCLHRFSPPPTGCRIIRILGRTLPCSPFVQTSPTPDPGQPVVRCPCSFLLFQNVLYIELHGLSCLMLASFAQNNTFALPPWCCVNQVSSDC